MNHAETHEDIKRHFEHLEQRINILQNKVYCLEDELYKARSY